MRYSILHLSDLHRDLSEEVENPALIESLRRDVERYHQNCPPIPIPALAIVSGDLVYGVGANHPNPAEELARQYCHAEKFLISLADRFFAGNRDRVIILPGNHDVSMFQVIASLAKVDLPASDEARNELIGKLWKPNTKHRWIWRTLSLHVINDQAAYEKRLEQFAAMYERFYLGRRKFSLVPEEQFDFFDFPDVQFSCFALNSCYQNDPFRRIASIHPTCLARASEMARKPELAGRILGAAWHHNLSGGPQQDDYLDSGVLQFFIDVGISLGFHGHQHRSECIEPRFLLDDRNKYMTVLSAGTLCSGPAGLPSGESRSYNVIEVDNEKFDGRLHHRKMTNADFTQPIWTSGYFSVSQKSHIDFKICPPSRKRPHDLDMHLLLENAEHLVRAGKFRECLEVLRTLVDREPARPLILEALMNANDHDLTMHFILVPTTTLEAVLLGSALLTKGGIAEIRQFLSLEFVKSSADASVRDVVRRLEKKAK